MPTRNIVPREDNEGKLGTSVKAWQELNVNNVFSDVVNANEVYAGNNVLVFSTVDEMKAGNKIGVGYTLRTLGFYTAGDGGGADYIVTNNIGGDEADEASIIALQKGLYAKLLIKDFINVKQWGAYGDGIHDDTQAIQNCIDKNAKTIIYFPKGIYGISNTIKTSRNPEEVVMLDLQNSTLKVLDNFPANTFMLIIGGKGTYVDDGVKAYHWGLRNAILEGNNINTYGFKVEGAHTPAITDVKVWKVIKGLVINSSQDNSSSDCYLDRIDLSGNADADSSALEINGYDNKISNVRTGFFARGITVTGGGNFLFRCHPLGWLIYIPGTIAFAINGANNYLTECYSDGFNVALQINNNAGVNVRDFFALFNGVNNSDCILIQNTGDVYKSIIDNVYANFGDVTANKHIYKGTYATWIDWSYTAILNNVRVVNGSKTVTGIESIPIISFTGTPPYSLSGSTNFNITIAKGLYYIKSLPTGLDSTAGINTDLKGQKATLLVRGTPVVVGNIDGTIEQTLTIKKDNVVYRYCRIGLYTTSDASDISWAAWKEL